MCDLTKDLEKLLAKRDKIRAKQTAMYANGTHTRAKTTTMNAQADQVNARIVWLREELEKAKRNVRCATADDTLPKKHVAMVENQIIDALVLEKTIVSLNH